MKFIVQIVSLVERCASGVRLRNSEKGAGTKLYNSLSTDCSTPNSKSFQEFKKSPDQQMKKQGDWLQPNHFWFTMLLETPNTSLRLPVVSDWMCYLSDYVTSVFNTEVCPVNLSDAFDRIVTLPLPSPPFSLRTSLQVKRP